MFRAISNLLRGIFPDPQLEVTVYSSKKRGWVTVTVPEGRLDLVGFEVRKLESQLPEAKPPRKKQRELEGMEELHEWIKKVLIHHGTFRTEEMIMALGTRYNSLEALLSIAVPVVGEDIIGLTRAEHEFLRSFGEIADGSYAVLRSLKAEVYERKEDEIYRGRGYCCSLKHMKEGWAISMPGCCEKGEPENWEIERARREQMRQNERFERERKESSNCST